MVWTDAENLAPTGIQSPDRPGGKESLYRLSYPAHTPAVCNTVLLAIPAHTSAVCNTVLLAIPTHTPAVCNTVLLTIPTHTSAVCNNSIIAEFENVFKEGPQRKLYTGLEFLEVLRKTTRSLRIANDLGKIQTRNFQLQDYSITTTPTTSSGHRVMPTFAEIDFNQI